MAQIATLIAVMAALGAAASWIAGTVLSARALHAAPGASRSAVLRWLTAIAWPFALSRLRSIGPELTVRLNKALLAIFAFLTIALAAASVATNLSRLSR